MIERKFIARNLKTHIINKWLEENLNRVGYSGTKVQRTPLGEKVIIYASRPGLIVGKKGSNIKKLTKELKEKFGLDNPQVEISEIKDINLDAEIVAERIASYLERFGSSRFKSIGHRVIGDVMGAGAIGIEVIISGKLPGSRSKNWRFYQGYLKKCGDMAVSGIRKSTKIANLKSGAVGIKVRIMPRELREEHEIQLKKGKEEVVEEVKEKEKKSEPKKEVKENKNKEKGSKKEKEDNKEKKKKTKKPAKEKSKSKKENKDKK